MVTTARDGRLPAGRWRPIRRRGQGRRRAREAWRAGARGADHGGGWKVHPEGGNIVQLLPVRFKATGCIAEAEGRVGTEGEAVQHTVTYIKGMAVDSDTSRRLWPTLTRFATLKRLMLKLHY